MMKKATPRDLDRLIKTNPNGTERQSISDLLPSPPFYMITVLELQL